MPKTEAQKRASKKYDAKAKGEIMSEREENKKVMGDFISIARKNHYSENMIMNIGIVCGSKQMHENGYTTHDAFLKAKEYAEKGKTASENIYELMKLAGYDS